MRIKIFAIVDTNVLISAAISRSGSPQDVYSYIGTGNIVPIFDKRILDEYYKVFNYDKFKGTNIKMPSFKDSDVYDILYDVVKNGIFSNDVEPVKEFFIDKKDIPFFEVKMSSEEFNPYLITGNMKHFPESDTTVTPKEMISIMKYLNKFLSNDINYIKIVDELIEKNLIGIKYSSGNQLLDKIFDKRTKTIKSEFFR